MKRNRGRNKGVTLVEVMIALVILLLVFMGLIQASLVSIQGNVRNELRDEAVRITSDQMSVLRAAPFGSADLASTGGAWAQLPNTGNRFTRNVRNASVTYTVERQVDDLPDAEHKQIQVRSTWQWQGENFTHTIAATRGR